MIEITNEIAKDIILRNVIRKQSGTKIAQELGCAQSTVNQLIRAYNLIAAADWHGLEVFAESAPRTALAKCRTCEDALGMSIPGAIWDRLQAAEKRGKEKFRAPEKPKAEAEEAKEEKKEIPDNTAWAVSQVLTKLDTLIVSMSDMQKYLIAYAEVTKANAELMKNIGLAVSELPGSDTLHALAEKITDCINANADVELKELRNGINSLQCTVKKLR